MNSDSRTIHRRQGASSARQGDGTSDSLKTEAALQFKALEGASAPSSLIGVIRRLRRGRWTLTEVHR
jgi:hypothetical protein